MVSAQKLAMTEPVESGYRDGGHARVQPALTLIRQLLVIIEVVQTSDTVEPNTDSPFLGRPMRTQKAHAVEVNKVRWRIRNPPLSFPRNFPKVAAHNGPIREGSDINQPRSRLGKELSKLFMSFAINRPMAGDRLDSSNQFFSV